MQPSDIPTMHGDASIRGLPHAPARIARSVLDYFDDGRPIVYVDEELVPGVFCEIWLENHYVWRGQAQKFVRVFDPATSHCMWISFGDDGACVSSFQCYNDDSRSTLRVIYRDLPVGVDVMPMSRFGFRVSSMPQLGALRSNKRRHDDTCSEDGYRYNDCDMQRLD